MIALGVQRARAIPAYPTLLPSEPLAGAYLLVAVGLPCPRFAPEHSCRQLAAGYKAGEPMSKRIGTFTVAAGPRVRIRLPPAASPSLSRGLVALRRNPVSRLCGIHEPVIRRGRRERSSCLWADHPPPEAGCGAIRTSGCRASWQAEADQHGDEVQSKQQERGTPHAIDTSSGQWDRTQHSRVVEAAEQGRCNSEL